MEHLPACSILMSIYNEPLSYVNECVSSLLKQSYDDFELIIVIDNPTRIDVNSYLCSLCDSRIIIAINECNIGLAMSMNKASQLARSKILVRMDADDIAEPDRLYYLFQKWEEGIYDLLFSDYSFIDDNSKPIERISGIENISNANLSYKVQLASMIHHPTVMFSKEIFLLVGMYRDFPCAQDIDLWLRMAEVGCRFGYVNRKLLRYRINTKGVSSKKWFQQHITAIYIYKLSISRLLKGYDDYSDNNYRNFLEKCGVGNDLRHKRFRLNYDRLDEAQKCSKSGDRLKSIFLRIQVFLTSRVYRNHYLRMLYKKILLKFI